jgi:superfamily II helicase
MKASCMDIYAMVRRDIIEEEMKVVKGCSCCFVKASLFILVQKSGIATVLEHVCMGCLKDLCALIDRDLASSYAYVMK